MGRLKKYAKKSKEEFHQYPWKVDYEQFAFFSKYCESLNLSVNEGLSLLVGDELEPFKLELSEEERKAILDEFRIRKGMFLRGEPPMHCQIPPDVTQAHASPAQARRPRGKAPEPE